MSSLKLSKWFFAFLPYKMAFGMSSILVPLFVIALGGTVADVGLVTAAFLITSIPASIFWAKFSDRSGSRKVFVLFAFLSTSITFLLFAIARNPRQLILFNALQGFLITAAIPTSSMIVVERTPKNQWNFQMALFNFVGGIGWALGLLLGAAALLDMRSLFIICLILVDLSYILSFFWISEPNVSFERESLKIFIPKLHRTLPSTLIHLPIIWERRIFRTLKNGVSPKLPLYYVGTLMIFMGATTFFTPLPVYMKKTGLSENSIFLIFFVNAVLAALSYPLAGRMSQRTDDKKLVIYATSLRVILFSSTAITIILPLSFTPYFLAFIVGMGGFTWSFLAVSGVTLVPKLSMLGKEGAAVGIYNAMASLGSVGGSILGSIIAYTLGYEAAFLFAASLLVMATITLRKIEI